MSSETLVDREYETIVEGLHRTYRNVDPYLLIKSAMLRKKYPNESKQHFWLDIYYKEGINHSNKGTLILSKVGRMLSYKGHNHYTIDIQAKLDTILLLASDTDIERIDGEVFPISA